MNPALLGVNIDHVATLREARYRNLRESRNAMPNPLEAALEAERAGAAGITAHLRADRRHIQDADIRALKANISTKLNLEMGNTPEILAIALELLPADVCLVPENRQEVTTEGGLDCVANFEALAPTVAALADAGIKVSMFIDPEIAQVEASAKLGAPCIELHTGAYAEAENPSPELDRLHSAAARAAELGLQVNAGHGLHYANVYPVAAIPGIRELNIGHAIVSRAIFAGMQAAVSEMIAAIRGAAA